MLSKKSKYAAQICCYLLGLPRFVFGSTTSCLELPGSNAAFPDPIFLLPVFMTACPDLPVIKPSLPKKFLYLPKSSVYFLEISVCLPELFLLAHSLPGHYYRKIGTVLYNECTKLCPIELLVLLCNFFSKNKGCLLIDKGRGHCCYSPRIIGLESRT